MSNFYRGDKSLISHMFNFYRSDKNLICQMSIFHCGDKNLIFQMFNFYRGVPRKLHVAGGMPSNIRVKLDQRPLQGG